MGSSRSGLLHRVSLPLSLVVQFGTFLKVVVLNEVRPDVSVHPGAYLILHQLLQMRLTF